MTASRCTFHLDSLQLTVLGMMASVVAGTLEDTLLEERTSSPGAMVSLDSLAMGPDVDDGADARGAPKKDVKEACCCSFADADVLGRLGLGGDDMAEIGGGIDNKRMRNPKLGCIPIQ